MHGMTVQTNPAMKTTPYWIDTAVLPKFPRLTQNIRVDVAVIGGGITGITAAYLLKQAGLTVALLERDGFAAAETGHTTAHLTYVTDLRLSELVKNFGRDHAQAAWDAGRAAIEQIHALSEAEEIACEFAWVPGYLHAPLAKAPADEESRLRKDARLAVELGFDAAFEEKVPFMGRAGIRFSNQAKFHPRKYLAGLLQTIPGKGCARFRADRGRRDSGEPLRVKAKAAP